VGHFAWPAIPPIPESFGNGPTFHGSRQSRTGVGNPDPGRGRKIPRRGGRAKRIFDRSQVPAHANLKDTLKRLWRIPQWNSRLKNDSCLPVQRDWKLSQAIRLKQDQTVGKFD